MLRIRIQHDNRLFIHNVTYACFGDELAYSYYLPTKQFRWVLWHNQTKLNIDKEQVLKLLRIWNNFRE